MDREARRTHKMQYRQNTIPLNEFTRLQQRVIWELGSTKWNWRSEDALLDAIESERECMRVSIAIDGASLLDRQERGERAIETLHNKRIIMRNDEHPHYLHFNNIENKVFYSLTKTWRFLLK